MNWNAIAAVAESLGALGVILSLIYLAAQVRRGIRQAQSDAMRDLARGVNEISLTLAADSEPSVIFAKGNAGFDGMTAHEQQRYRTLCNTIFHLFEQQFLLREDGSLNDEAWNGVSQMIADFAKLPGVHAYFADRGNWYSPRFVQYLRAAGLRTGSGRSFQETYVTGEVGDQAS
jgi:hypothetical protein